MAVARTKGAGAATRRDPGAAPADPAAAVPASGDTSSRELPSRSAIRRGSVRRSPSMPRRISAVLAPVRSRSSTDPRRPTTSLRSRLARSARRRAAPPTMRSSEPSQDATRARSTPMATAPINKEAFAAAGLPWKGHTDLLAHLTGVTARCDDVPLRRAAGRAGDRPYPALRGPGGDHADSSSKISWTSRRASCRDSGSRARGSAVAGLNPHAGEHGLLGSEDDARSRARRSRPAPRVAST